MDGLREGINLRGYAQRDPKIEYQREGFGMFEEMQVRMDQQVAETLFKFVLPDPRPAAAPPPRPVAPRPPIGGAPQAAPRPAGAAPAAAPQGKPTPFGGGAPKSTAARGSVGRNDPCPCGSGKKHKKCCGA